MLYLWLSAEKKEGLKQMRKDVEALYFITNAFFSVILSFG